MARLSTIPAYFAAALTANNNNNTTPDAKAASPTLQLPTPISSCPSDTSSCVENASTPEESSKTQPRATRRVTRASLRAGTVPPQDEDQQSKDEESESVNSQESRDVAVGADAGDTSRSAHSEEAPDTTTETPSGGQPKQNATTERRVTRRSARFEASKDAKPASGASSCRSGPEEELEESKGGTKQMKEKKDKDDGGPVTRRRSTRLTLLDKTSAAVGRASTILGKRSRDAMDKGKDKAKDVGRRASLRPRNVASQVATPAKSEAPEPKKRRVSESDAAAKKKTASEDTSQPAKPPPKRKPKRWLSHGLYVGQDRNFDPRLSEAKNRARIEKEKASGPPQRTLLPLPIFAGERLLEQGRDFKLPFDIFCPLPGAQPKPDEWKKVNKNVFVGDAVNIWKATKRGEVSTCMCTPEMGCDEDCQNRYMFYECDDTNCKLGPDLCKNRSFEGLRQRTKAGGKFNIGVEVMKTEDRGYGIRSNRTFEPNQIIVEYTGEILTQEDAEHRMRKVYKNSECYYLMYFDQNMIIDATRGSMARFVNHSCEPNCRMEKWTVAGKPRMALFAGERGVMTGEELTYDYNFDPFSQKNVQECRCGADSCRGFLGPRPKETKSKDNSKNSTTSKPKGAKLTKRGPAGTKRKIDDSVLSNKPTSQLNKKRKTAVPSLVKAGVKRVVSKTSSRGKSAAGAKSKSTTAKITKSKPQKTQRKPAPTSSSGRTLNRPSKPIVHSSIRSARATARSPAALKRLMSASTGRASRRGKSERAR